MPKIVVTHQVKDLAHWASKHSERVAAFAPWGTNVVDHLAADGSNNVAVSIDVHDLPGLQKALTTPEVQAAKDSHGVIDPLVVFVENR
jgi:hypothetical protein